MKIKFIQNLFIDDIDNIDDETEYLLINTLIVNKKFFNYISPKFHFKLKFIYIQKVRYKANFVKPSIDLFKIPFDCIFKKGFHNNDNNNYLPYYYKNLYDNYNLTIKTKYIKKYIIDDIKKFLNDIVFWYSVDDKSNNIDHTYDTSLTNSNKEYLLIYPVFYIKINKDKIKNLN
jgi:hypothetical protein